MLHIIIFVFLISIYGKLIQQVGPCCILEDQQGKKPKQSQSSNNAICHVLFTPFNCEIINNIINVIITIIILYILYIRRSCVEILAMQLMIQSRFNFSNYCDLTYHDQNYCL